MAGWDQREAEDLVLAIWCFCRKYFGEVGTDWMQGWGAGGGGDFIPAFIPERVRNRIRIDMGEPYGRAGRIAAERGLRLGMKDFEWYLGLVEPDYLALLLGKEPAPAAPIRSLEARDAGSHRRPISFED